MGIGRLFLIVGVSWFLCMEVGVWFRKSVQDSQPAFSKSVVDHANNILFYGIGGIIGIFFGTNAGNVLQYIILGVFTLLTVIDLIPTLVSLVLNFVLLFERSPDADDLTRPQAWIFMLSKMIYQGLMVFLTYVMVDLFLLT